MDRALFARGNAAGVAPGLTRGVALRRATLLMWLVVAGLAAVLVGAASGLHPLAAVILVAGLVLAIVVAVSPVTMLLILVASLFVQVASVGGLTIGRLLAPAALLVVVVSLLRGAASLQGGAPLAWAAGYAGWALASGLWSIEIDSTTRSLASLGIALAYAVAFAALLRFQNDVKAVLYTLAVVAFGVGVYAMSTSGRRAGETTGDANYFAAVEVMALPLVLISASQATARWLRVALYGVAVVMIAAIFSSLSRGGLLALGVVLAFTLLIPARTFFASRAQKAIVIAFLLVGIVVAFRLTSEELTPRLETIFTPEGRTGSGRLNAWRAAWTSIQERPLLGLGYGAFEPSANELMLRTPGVDLSNYVLRPGGLEAHSAYIGTAADLGLPGLALFLGLLASTARTLRRAATHARRVGAASSARIANGLFVSLMGWSVASLFLSAETARPLWIMIGMSLALPALIRNEAMTRPTPVASVGNRVQRETVVEA